MKECSGLHDVRCVGHSRRARFLPIVVVVAGFDIVRWNCWQPDKGVLPGSRGNLRESISQ